MRLTIYTSTKPALAHYVILLITGEHTHLRPIRAIPRGHLGSRVFELLRQDPMSTRAQLAKRIRDDKGLQPNSAAIRHAWADYRLTRNPLREGQVGVMARMAASAGGSQYIRKVVVGARAADDHSCTYSYVTFALDAMLEVAAMQSSFCANLSLKDYSSIAAATDGTGQQWHLFSITTWSRRLHRTASVFKGAIMGESANMYQELLEEFLRECSLRGQLMPPVGTVVTKRTLNNVTTTPPPARRQPATTIDPTDTPVTSARLPQGGGGDRLGTPKRARPAPTPGLTPPSALPASPPVSSSAAAPVRA